MLTLVQVKAVLSVATKKKTKKAVKRWHLPQDFQGHTFSIVTMKYAPFSCYDKLPSGQVKLRDCVDTRMLDAISTLLNFTYRVREPEDGHWGYKLEDGNYTGGESFIRGLESSGKVVRLWGSVDIEGNAWRCSGNSVTKVFLVFGIFQ